MTTKTIHAPRSLDTPFLEATLDVPDEMLRTFARDRGSRPLERPLDMGVRLVFGQPVAWRLTESMYLIQVTMSFLPGPDRTILGLRLDARFSGTNASRDCRVHDIYPRLVDGSSDREATSVCVIDAMTGLHFIDCGSDATPLVRLEQVVLVPKLAAAGQGTPMASWDFLSWNGHPVIGSRTGYVILEAPPSPAGLDLGFGASAVVETPLSLLPIAVNRRISKQFDCHLDLPGVQTAAKGFDRTSDGVQRPVKILFIAANPGGTLRIDAEVRAVDRALQGSRFRDRFEIVQHGAVTVRDLQELLLRHAPNIVHFSGHGSTASELILEDESGIARPVSQAALAKTFSVLKEDIRCVVLNACMSDQQAVAIAQYIGCVVGMSRSILDQAALDFSLAFYQALGYGRDVQTAFDLGCAMIDLDGIPGDDIPRLYLAAASGTPVFI